MKKSLLCITMLLVAFGLSACACQNATGVARIAAKEYIRDKYDREAEIVKINKNYVGTGTGFFPEFEADGSFNVVMDMGDLEIDVCLAFNGSDYIGFDNYEEYWVRANYIYDVESNLGIRCEEVFLSYSELDGKYGTNMLHEVFSDLPSLYKSGKFAAIVATHDAIDPGSINEYATQYEVEDDKQTLRIEIIQYKDKIPELGFSSFGDVTDQQYVLDWYTISRGTVTHH